MSAADIPSTLTTLFGELVDGTPPTGGYMLNRGDPGLLRSLERITAAEASRIVSGGSSIAAHVDHVTYYLTLMNRWARGERNPWRDADWKASWRRTDVSEESWAQRRGALAAESSAWSHAMSQPRTVSAPELTGMVASIAHLAYHVGAIRQMDRTLRGPSANNEPDAFPAA